MLFIHHPASYGFAKQLNIFSDDDMENFAAFIDVDNMNLCGRNLY